MNADVSRRENSVFTRGGAESAPHICPASRDASPVITLRKPLRSWWLGCAPGIGALLFPDFVCLVRAQRVYFCPPQSRHERKELAKRQLKIIGLTPRRSTCLNPLSHPDSLCVHGVKESIPWRKPAVTPITTWHLNFYFAEIFALMAAWRGTNHPL